MQNMFEGCSNLESLKLESFNTENVVSMNQMFSGCKSLTLLDLRSFNMQNLTDISDMFEGCTSLSILNLANFNVPKIPSMYYILKTRFLYHFSIYLNLTRTI